MIWATVTYVGVGMLFTLVEVPSQTLIVRVTDESADRMRLSRAKTVIGTFGVILPPVLNQIARDETIVSINRVRFFAHANNSSVSAWNGRFIKHLVFFHFSAIRICRFFYF